MARNQIMRLTAGLLCAALLLSCTAKTGSSDAEQASTEYVISAPEDKTYLFESNQPVFSLDGSFYAAKISVELLTPTEAEIYYTEDGSEPDRGALRYEAPLLYDCEDSDFPTAHTIKAKAYYPDGTESETAVHTYFCASGINDRFTTAVFSVTGDPDVLTEGPDGIFYGKNYELRGDESERAAYVEAWDKNGALLLSQDCGIRIYGGVSREASIKSMKLIARKSYGDFGSFHTDLFGTLVEDGSGTAVEKYKKLVLRNSGNDFQFAYIRDELCQTLAADAGFTDYESVVPAVCYLNGSYYGFFWLHESYCDDYFKNKYPNEAAMGEFVIAEGTELEKDESEDGGDEVYAAEFNQLYAAYAYADLTDDAVYQELCAQLDVENYLDYFAFNCYINNKDWPQNNYRCYRYVPAAGEDFSDSVYDGKWRFLIHDTDYTLGMYEQRETQANYNNLQEILTKNSERYAPLFDALLHREDCRSYFQTKMSELAEGALSAEHIDEVLTRMDTSRLLEQRYYYKHLEALRNGGDSSIWSYSEHLIGYLRLIREFSDKRADYMEQFVEQALSGYEESADAEDPKSEAEPIS